MARNQNACVIHVSEIAERVMDTYWSDLAVGVGDGTHDSGAKDATAFVCNRIQCVECCLEPGRDQLAEKSTAIGAKSTKHEAVYSAQNVHLPLLLQTKISQPLNERQVSKQAVDRNCLKESDGHEDRLYRIKIEGVRDA